MTGSTPFSGRTKSRALLAAPALALAIMFAAACDDTSGGAKPVANGTITFTVNGTLYTFTNGGAKYYSFDDETQIYGDDESNDSIFIDIYFPGRDIGAFDKDGCIMYFSDSDFYEAGTNTGNTASTVIAIEINRYDTTITGTFSGTLFTVNGDEPIFITDGSFSVPYLGRAN